MRFIGWLVVLLAVAGAAAYFLGWIDVQKNNKSVTVEVDRDKIKTDLEKLKERATDVGENISEAVKGAKSVTGKVTRIEADSLTVAPASGPEVTFQVNADTKVIRASKPIKLAEVAKGEEIKVGYKEIDAKNVALSVHVNGP